MESGQVLRILTDEEPSLREPSAQVDTTDPLLATHVADLAATLSDFRERAGFGRAISAPQVGIQKRLVVLNLGDGPVALVNPSIVAKSPEMQRVWDDCLSVPDTLVQVERHLMISVAYETPAGEPVQWRDLPADLAELLQHEIDHLDGILMTDRALPGAIRPLSDRELVTKRQAHRH